MCACGTHPPWSSVSCFPSGHLPTLILSLYTVFSITGIAGCFRVASTASTGHVDAPNSCLPALYRFFIYCIRQLRVLSDPSTPTHCSSMLCYAMRAPLSLQNVVPSNSAPHRSTQQLACSTLFHACCNAPAGWLLLIMHKKLGLTAAVRPRCVCVMCGGRGVQRAHQLHLPANGCCRSRPCYTTSYDR